MTGAARSKTCVSTLFAALLVAAPQARSDAAAPEAYYGAVTGNRVIICNSYNVPICAPSTPMLRQDTASGELVQLATFCLTDSDAGYTGCYEDECVPAGTYLYGLETPYADTCAAGADALPPAYWESVSVTAALSGSCARSSGDNGPVAHDGGSPWPADGGQWEACGGSSSGGSSSTTSGSSSTTSGSSSGSSSGSGSSATGSSTSGGSSGSKNVTPSGGCSSVGGSVLAIDAGFMLLSLALLWRARRVRR